MTCIAEGAEGDLSMDLIDRQAAIDALYHWEMCYTWDEHCREYRDLPYIVSPSKVIDGLPSAQPDFSCDGCQTPKHICGICMRNYPNITDHYCTGEWTERREE